MGKVSLLGPFGGDWRLLACGKVISYATASPTFSLCAVSVNSVPTGPDAGSTPTAPASGAGAAGGRVEPPLELHEAAPAIRIRLTNRPPG